MPGETTERAKRGVLARYVPEGERVHLRLKPSPLSILLVPLGTFFWLIVIALAALFCKQWIGEWGSRVALVAFVLIVARLVWSWLEWLARLYVLTDARVIRVTGVLRQLATDVPLVRIQNVTIHRKMRERMFGLGTIGFATAGTGGIEAAWLMVDHPPELAQRVRKAARRASKGEPAPSTGRASAAPVIESLRADHDAGGKGVRPVVIGLAGGVGSGKSTVARMFAQLGAVVIDSDEQAKLALDRPEVRDRLVEWWGAGVVGADGRVDRKAVAGIVFGDEDERRRLEELVHPLVRSKRAELVEKARSAGAPAVVVDAPLLFEAGLDSECDAVVFVESSRGDRLARVRETRGWDEKELARRESAQIALDEKRARSDEVVENTGSEDELRERVRACWGRVVGGGKGA